jgi:hypothetical protein
MIFQSPSSNDHVRHRTARPILNRLFFTQRADKYPPTWIKSIHYVSGWIKNFRPASDLLLDE